MTNRWYAVHAYSNFENKVADSIREQAKQRGLSDLFEEILVPKEKVIEVRRGRKVDAERKFFPGYVLVKMQLTDEAYHLIKNTPKVTGFLGSDNKPMPRLSASSTRLRKASNGPSPRCRSKWASRCACPMGRSPRSTARWKRSTRDARGSRSRCRSSAALRRSSSNSVRWRSYKFSSPVYGGGGERSSPVGVSVQRLRKR